MSRRTLLTGAALAAAGPLWPKSAQAQTSGAAQTSAAADGMPTVLLEAKPGVVEFQAGQPTDIFGFGGKAPGPELRLRKGEAFRAKLVNSTTRPLTLHWHGMRIVNDMDGVAGLTQDPVAPGSSAEIRFTPPDAGTFIYRPLAPGFTAELTERGLAGVVVVEDPAAPAVDLDRVIAVDDWRLSDQHQLEPFGAAEDRASVGRLGNLLTVNGARAPERISVAPGARVRLRLANLCNARLMRIRFEGVKAFVIATDGQPTDSFEPLRSTLPFAPGTRYDVMFDAGDAGSGGSVTAVIGQGLPLVEVKVEGEPMSARRPPPPPMAPLGDNPLLPPAIPLQKAQRADVVIEGGAKPGPDGKAAAYAGDPNRIWTINGQGGLAAGDKSPGKPVLVVKRGATVVLALVNRTPYPQVMHVHGHSFRLLHPLDDGWEPYWLDTVIVPEGQTARIAFVADNKGKWLIGSTVLERLDTGLSAWIDVS
ncbi:multicopper oxidase family protein [Alsobacter sp. KACC 23698]|uniref:Multicopper oxidase family protein n=1 Tax=Alsobacter sp. KACC 23698 TaxID=3149229 RepID=A0AAU7JMS1_9HYPH